MKHNPSVLHRLSQGSIDIDGRMPNSSNATFLVTIGAHGNDDTSMKAIYKPLSGERPLWDFDPGLYKREVAAYRLSDALGYHVVPPTVVREGPLGEGSLQLFIDHDPAQHYFTFLDGSPELHDRLRTLAVFDIVANNTDRKGGHVLVDDDSNVWGIDHGVCFSEEFKLRTVIWDFAGDHIDESLLAPLEPFVQSVPVNIAALLTDDEIEAMIERTVWLLENRIFPAPESRYQYPWPLL
jgi:uncharacterized repeat protein (TIGR03843 family)